MPIIHNKPILSVVIAGAGGFGLEVFDYLENEAEQNGFYIAGFIDDIHVETSQLGLDVSYINTIENYKPMKDQVVIVAIGSVKGRKSVFSRLWDKGVETPAYVHPCTIISSSAQLGKGVLVCPYSIIHRNVTIADGVVINLHCNLAHGASVGTYSVLSPYVAFAGDTVVGKECFFGSRSTVYPRIRIGDNCIIDSHTGVRANSGDKQMISSRSIYRMVPIRP